MSITIIRELKYYTYFYYITIKRKLNFYVITYKKVHTFGRFPGIIFSSFKIEYNLNIIYMLIQNVPYFISRLTEIDFSTGFDPKNLL